MNKSLKKIYGSSSKKMIGYPSKKMSRSPSKNMNGRLNIKMKSSRSKKMHIGSSLLSINNKLEIRLFPKIWILNGSKKKSKIKMQRKNLKKMWSKILKLLSKDKFKSNCSRRISNNKIMKRRNKKAILVIENPRISKRLIKMNMHNNLNRI